MAATIVLDAGHGGRDNGAVFNGRREKDDNLDLALAVGNILENNGFNVVYTRTTDVYDTPYQKAVIGNEANADFFVSFHRNSSEVPGRYSGVQTLVYDDSGIKAELARQINENLENVGFTNLGVSVRPDLAVLRRTQMPSVLIETGFINSEKDNALYDSQFQEIAAGIADAITEVVGSVEQGTYYIQTGLYNVSSYADTLANRLWLLGYPADIDQYQGYTRVRVGPYSSLEQAAEVERKLRADGFQTLLLQS